MTRGNPANIGKPKPLISIKIAQISLNFYADFSLIGHELPQSTTILPEAQTGGVNADFGGFWPE